MANEIFTNFILLGSYGDVNSKIHSLLVQVHFERKLLHMMQITKCVSNLLHFNFTLFLYVEIRYFLKILTINFTFILKCVTQSIYYTDHIFFYTFSVHLAFVTDRKYTVVSPLVASIGTDSVFRNSMTLS